MALVKIGVLFPPRNSDSKVSLSGILEDETKKLFSEKGEDKLKLLDEKENAGRLVVFKNHSNNSGKTWYDLCLQTGDDGKQSKDGAASGGDENDAPPF